MTYKARAITRTRYARARTNLNIRRNNIHFTIQNRRQTTTFNKQKNINKKTKPNVTFRENSHVIGTQSRQTKNRKSTQTLKRAR
jgi:hypothetical protein